MARRAYERERERRRRALRRRRQTALGSLLLICGGVAALIVLVLVPALSGAGGRRTADGHPRTSTETTSTTTITQRPGPPFAVGVRTLRFQDNSRTVRYANGTLGPRIINAEIRYPAQGPPGPNAIHQAAPQRASGPYPLIVFGHGFALLPIDYHRLLNAWASAGYVVAAPIFPAENLDAPGGPDEEDLPNQPDDMKLVISEMEKADHSSGATFSGLIDTEEVAVAGHSDGGDTALALAYGEGGGEGQSAPDPGVKAAVILSGAAALGPSSFPAEGPPLLAVQGTNDTVNHPSETTAYFQRAGRPKYLLELLGAEHLPPYTTQEPDLRIVEKVSIDFLNRYLKQRNGSLQAMKMAANVRGVASLQTYR